MVGFMVAVPGDLGVWVSATSSPPRHRDRGMHVGEKRLASHPLLDGAADPIGIRTRCAEAGAGHGPVQGASGCRVDCLALECLLSKQAVVPRGAALKEGK